MRKGLQTAEGTFEGLNQLVSDSMESITAEISEAEEHVVQNDRILDQQIEKVENLHQAYIKAEIVCLEYLSEVNKAKENLSSAEDKETNTKRASAFLPLAAVPTFLLNPVIGIGLGAAYFLAGEHTKKEANLVTTACAERYESASETLEKHQQTLEQCKAAFEDGKKKVSSDIDSSHEAHLHKEILAALQKYIFSVGERMKHANFLVAQISRQAGTAEFMVEFGTMEELTLVLNEMQLNLESFQKIVPALSL